MIVETIKNAVSSHPRSAAFMLLLVIASLMQLTVGLAPPGDGGGPF